MSKIDTSNIEVMKGFVTSYGWTQSKISAPIDDKVIPNHICEDFDDDCHSLKMTHWNCFENHPDCGMCPFVLEEVSEEIKKYG